MDWRAIDDCTSGRPLTVDWRSLPNDGNRSMLGLKPEIITVLQCHKGIVRFAKLARALDNRLKNRPDIGRRGCDHAEDVAATGLVSQRLREVAGFRLHLVEQSDVFDRDHRLVGEGLEQFALPVGERPRGPAQQRERANRLPFAQEWW